LQAESFLNNNTMKKTITLLVLLFAAFTIQAQDAVFASGGDATGTEEVRVTL
jgi:hypothetical protein